MPAAVQAYILLYYPIPISISFVVKQDWTNMAAGQHLQTKLIKLFSHSCPSLQMDPISDRAEEQLA